MTFKGHTWMSPSMEFENVEYVSSGTLVSQISLHIDVFALFSDVDTHSASLIL